MFILFIHFWMYITFSLLQQQCSYIETKAKYHKPSWVCIFYEPYKQPKYQIEKSMYHSQKGIEIEWRQVWKQLEDEHPN